MTALLLFYLLFFCYSVFFTSNLFLCLSVTLSFLRATCFFVLLLLCLFYVQFVSLSFCYSVFLRAICFFVLLLLCLLYKQFVSLSFCYSVFFTCNLFLCPPVTLSSLQATCQLVHSSTRQLVTQLLKILNIVFATMNIRKNMFIFAADFMK